MAMRYYSVEFFGKYPIGAARAIVVARDRGHAYRLLREKLEQEDLWVSGNPSNKDELKQSDFEQIEPSFGVQFFHDGDY